MKPTLDASNLEILPASAVTEMVKRAATRPLEILTPTVSRALAARIERHENMAARACRKQERK